MGRPQTLAAPANSIVRQAGQRLLVSLGLFVLLLGYASFQIYALALEKSAQKRAEDLANFYRTRLQQQERDWELQASDYKVRLETTHLLEASGNTTRLQAFMTVQGIDRRFEHLYIEDRAGKRIFAWGGHGLPSAFSLPAGQTSGWHHDPASNDLYRVFVLPIWLGAEGNGRVAVFYDLSNALLFNLATPGITLAVWHGRQAVASSHGQAGLAAMARLNDEQPGQLQNIAWQPGDGSTSLAIHAPVQALFSSTELVLSAAAIPLIDGLILWFTLGFWLMHNGRRIKALGGAIRTYAAHGGPGPELADKLDQACGQGHDEISEVTDAIEAMAEQSLRREQERQQVEAQRRLWSEVFACSNEAILISDRDNNIVTVNRAFSQMTGYSEADVLGRNPRLLASGHEPHEFYATMWQQIHSQGNWSGEVLDRRKDGSVYPKWLNVSVVRDADGSIVNYIGTFIDITERKQNEAHLLHLAHHDALTGLPNRHLLLDRLHSAISQSKRNQQHLGILFLDLDNFKWANDSLGHASGDKLLVSVAARLQDSVRSSDTVARLGGDEFVVLLSQTDEEPDISQIAHKIIAAVARPLDLAGHDFHVTTSMGISLFPHDGEDPETLLKHADTAMYAAKSAGKNQYRYFDPVMNRHALQRVELEQDLRQALQRREFVLHYQPKLCLASNTYCGAEALIRWQHPRLGQLLPARFIPLAEETSQIVEIGAWVLGSACRQMVEWRALGLEPGRVAVNLSAVQLESDGLLASVAGILAETGARAEWLEFELTESVLLRNPQRSIATLQQLRDLGIHLTLDDFGTGQSSLAQLKRLPIDTLKIDRSFVEGVAEDANDAQIVRMIVALARAVHLDVVAEGIETRLQHDCLQAMGCEILQGHLISRPLPVEAYTALLSTGRPD